MKFRILGPLEVVDGERLVELGRPKQRAVLAVLLVDANRVVSVDRLMDLLWPGEGVGRSVGPLHAYISNLRKALEPSRPVRTNGSILVTQAPGYRLQVDSEDLDASRFARLVADARQVLEVDPWAARELLREALELWRGPALGEFAEQGFAVLEAMRLGELRAGAMDECAEADLALGDHVQAISRIEELVSDQPFRERRWELLMLALYRSGRQAEALRAATRARNILREELGLEPGPDLRRLEADILRHAPDLDWRSPRAKPFAPPGRAPLGGPPRPEASARGETGRPTTPPVVGRTGELVLLAEATEDVLEGHGRIVLLSGAPGIGKTRLAEELAVYAQSKGATVAWGRAYEGEGAPPFWPWLQVIRSLLANFDPMSVRIAVAPAAAAISQLVPEVAALAGIAEPPPPLDLASSRFRLYAGIADFLVRLADCNPLLILLDDVHWADPDSLQLAAFLSTAIERAPVLVAMAFRDLDPRLSAPMNDLVGRLARLPGLRRISLAGLSEPEVAEFIQQTAGVSPPRSITATIWARTDGNPFFVAELSRQLSAHEGLPGTEVGLVEAVPEGVRDVIRRTLSKLPDQSGDLLAIAAVAGRDFDLGVVASAAGLTEERAFELLDPAIARGLVAEDPQAVGRLRFAHALTQEAIREELTARQAAIAHGRVGLALEHVYGDDAPPSELAHHYYQAATAGDPERGVVACVRAADAALMVVAYEQATEHLRKAIELLQAVTSGWDRDKRELSLQLRLGTLLAITYGPASRRVEVALVRAAKLNQVVRDASEALPALWSLFYFAYSSGDMGQAAVAAERLQTLAQQTGDEPSRLGGLLGLGFTAFHRGALSVARDHFENALSIADRLADPSLAYVFQIDPRVYARGFLGVLSALSGSAHEADTHAAQAIAMAEQLDGRYSVVAALTMAAWLGHVQRDAAAVASKARSAAAIADELGFGAVAAAAAIYMGWTDAIEGRASEGRVKAQQGLRALLDTGYLVFRPAMRSLVAEAEGLAGYPEEALASIRTAIAEAEQQGDCFFLPELHRLEGWSLLARGPAGTQEAVACIQRGLHLAREQGSQLFEARAWGSLIAVEGA